MEIQQETYNKNSERNILFFSEMPLSTTEDDIRKLLGSYSIDLGNIAFKKPGTALLFFKDTRTAALVKAEFNLIPIGKKFLRIMWFQSDFKKVLSGHDSRNLFIKNIPLEVTPREFYQYFARFGEIASAKMKEGPNGQHYGYGYINYESSLAASTAINEAHGKAIFSKFPNVIIEVDTFKMFNQRENSNVYMNYLNTTSSKVYETKCSVFIKNISKVLKLEDLKSIFLKYGNIIYFKPILDDTQSFIKTTILSFDNEKSAIQCVADLNNMDFNGEKMIVEKLKADTLYESKILTQTPHSNCKLSVRNIPLNVKEDELVQIFSQFGKVISCKYLNQNVMTKDKSDGSFKEHTVFSGAAHLLFEKYDEAIEATKALNGKYLPKHETWKVPISVVEFKSKKEREEGSMSSIISSKLNSQPYIPQVQHPLSMTQPQHPMLQQPQIFNSNQPMHNYPNANMMMQQNQTPIVDYRQPPHNVNPSMYNQKNFTQPQPQPTITPENFYQTLYNVNPPQLGNNMIINSPYDIVAMTNQMNSITNNNNKNFIKKELESVSFKPIDIIYYNSINDESQRKDYLGESLFSNIMNHSLVEVQNIKLEEIGKMTGMILGMDDIKEILLTCSDYQELTSRIIEALKLLR